MYHRFSNRKNHPVDGERRFLNKRMDSMSQNIIGIDIGGTYIKIGVVNLVGKIIKKWKIETDRQAQGKYIVDHIWKSIEENVTTTELKNTLGIGIGVPGFIDKKQGTIDAVNIGWTNYELKRNFEERTHLPVVIENDANTAALGEYWHDSMKSDHLMLVTLGTGVGSGIILDGNVLHGHQGLAGEIGHYVVDPDGHPCNCGRSGCLDTIASATGVEREAMKIVQQDPNSMLAKLYSSHQQLTAKDVFDLAEAGDSHSQKIVHQLADSLGFVLANVATVINPFNILIGGGLSQAGIPFVQKIEASFKQHSLRWISQHTKIEIAKLGNDAGMIGSAYLIKKSLNKELSKC